MQANQRETAGRPVGPRDGMLRGGVAGAIAFADGSKHAGRGLGGPRGAARPSAGSDGGALDAASGTELIVLACVVSAFGVSPREIAARSRGLAHVALARQVAMYLHHVVLRQTLTAVARRFNRDRTTVAHACRVVEDRRDDPAFEELLDAIERAVHGALAPLCPAWRGQG